MTLSARGVDIDALELPPLPAVAAQVLRFASAPEADARALAALVERDPGLAATVLRVVRSPLWAGATPVATLQQAITRLGTRSLTEIAVAACLRPGPSPGPNAAAITDTWRHAVATASYARRIGALRRHHVEAVFLCGLLHSIGRSILLRATVATGVELERHAEVGAAAARRWGLPEAVAAAIAHHPRWATAPSHRDEAATTWFAARLARDPDDATLPDDPVLDWLGLYPDQVDALRAQRSAVAADVEGLK